MGIEYNPLWATLSRRKMKKKDLRNIISSVTIAKLTKNESVTTDTIGKLCTALDCEVSDILEFVHEKEQP